MLLFLWKKRRLFSFSFVCVEILKTEKEKKGLKSFYGSLCRSANLREINWDFAKWNKTFLFVKFHARRLQSFLSLWNSAKQLYELYSYAWERESLNSSAKLHLKLIIRVKDKKFCVCRTRCCVMRNMILIWQRRHNVQKCKCTLDRTICK